MPCTNKLHTQFYHSFIKMLTTTQKMSGLFMTGPQIRNMPRSSAKKMSPGGACVAKWKFTIKTIVDFLILSCPPQNSQHNIITIKIYWGVKLSDEFLRQEATVSRQFTSHETNIFPIIAQQYHLISPNMLIKKSKRWILWEKVTNAKCAWSFSQKAFGEHVC